MSLEHSLIRYLLIFNVLGLLFSKYLIFQGYVLISNVINTSVKIIQISKPL